MRRSSIAASVVGIALVVAAVVVRFVVAPATVKLPGDTNTTRTYAGTASTLLNTTALLAGNTSNVIAHNVPIVATHKTKVLKSHSGSALVADTHAISAAGSQLATSTYDYAVNRKTMNRGSGFSGATAQTGITFNFPIHTSKHDYTGWISDTSKPTNLHYTGTATRGGVHVYMFTTTAAASAITDTQQLRTLPPSLPKAQIPGLAAANGISPTLLASAAPLLATLPANVPLAYTYQLSATYYVAPASGVVVDLTQHEVRSAAISGAQGLPAFPIADFTFTSTPASLKAAAKDARDKGNQISLVESTLPWSLGIAGVVLLLAGLAMYVVGCRPRTVVMPDVSTGRTIPTPRETQADKPATTERA